VSRARLALVALVAAGFAVIALSGRVDAQAPGERVIMTPAEGTLQTRFQFTGTGFTPGQIVALRVIPADSSERRMRNDAGAELVWLVGADGSFSLDFVPSQHFPGAPPGHWRILFCGLGSLTCQMIELDVQS
jgi:hypothetical protein